MTFDVIDVMANSVAAIEAATSLADEAKESCPSPDVVQGDYEVVVKLAHWAQEAHRLAKVAHERERHVCNVCLGLSPRRDQHDKNPPCGPGATTMLLRHLGVEADL